MSHRIIDVLGNERKVCPENTIFRARGELFED